MSTASSVGIPAFEDVVVGEVGEQTPDQQSLVGKREQTHLGRRNLRALLKGWTYLWGSQRVLPHSELLSRLVWLPTTGLRSASAWHIHCNIWLALIHISKKFPQCECWILICCCLVSPPQKPAVWRGASVLAPPCL